jgi:hypothetical protein
MGNQANVIELGEAFRIERDHVEDGLSVIQQGEEENVERRAVLKNLGPDERKPILSDFLCLSNAVLKRGLSLDDIWSAFDSLVGR